MKYYFYWDTASKLIGAPIPEEDPAFPGAAIEARYAKEFLDSCVIVSEERMVAEGIHDGMIYDPETDTFTEPEPESTPEPEPEPVPEPTTPSAWDELVAQVMYSALMTDTLLGEEETEE